MRDPENFVDLEREEARAAADADDGLYDPDRPTRAEAERDEDRGPYRIDEDPYRGVCGGCGRRVSASGPEGSCIWTGGPWHPSCRETDRRAAA